MFGERPHPGKGSLAESRNEYGLLVKETGEFDRIDAYFHYLALLKGCTNRL